jgi:hypothetical protein
VVTTGAESVAAQASAFARLGRSTRSVLVNGVPDLITHVGGCPPTVTSLVTAGDHIARLSAARD